MKAYAVIFQKLSPPELLEVVKDYLSTVQHLNFVLCSEVNPSGAFLECHLVKNINDNNPWIVQIPIGYVLSVADMRKGKHPLGFLGH